MGSPLHCPLSDLPAFSYLEVVGYLLSSPLFQYIVCDYFSLQIPTGRPLAALSVAHVQPMGSEVGSSPVFLVWDFYIEQLSLIIILNFAISLYINFLISWISLFFTIISHHMYIIYMINLNMLDLTLAILNIEYLQCNNIFI